MEEEIKKAYMDWSEKGVSYLNCMCVYDIMMDVDEALQTCDTILDEIDLGIDYTSREKDIDRLLEGHGTLHRYIDVLNCYVDDKLDQPLKKDFKKNATETISRIHLEDFEVDITLGLTENNYITGGMGYAGTMVEQEKAKLTFADFIGTSDGKADGNGFHMAYTNGSVEDFASIFAAQYEAMKASGALGEDNNLTQQEFLEQFYRQGEFTHDSSNPFLNFVSSVLDITIIKPIIEACTGEDLITGEDLTDMERGLKVVFAVVDLVTLGGAIAATKFSEMGLKEGLKAFGKTALIDFAGNTAACGVGALGETFDWPVPITMMLSLAAGITVSISGNKLLFKNADGIEIGSKTLSDDDLKIVEQTIEGENYSNLTEVVSAKEAEVYLHFLESGSTEGMTESELKAVQKIEELIKSNKIDYDGILKIRNETVKSDVEVVRKTTEDSVEDVGKSAAEDAGKVVESGTYSGDLMSAEEAARYSKYWRELGIGSDNTWKAFKDANPNGTIDDYFEIVQKQSPWPLGETGTPTTLKAGDRFFMAVENNAPENVIGGFGVKERIDSTDFVRNNLAVKYDWKTSCNVIREFEVNSGIELNVNAGPVGSQIDLGADLYLPGDTTITQYDLFSNLGSGIKREDYVHIIDEYWVD